MMDAEQKLAALRALLLGLDQADPPPAPEPMFTPADWEEFAAEAKRLPAETKVKLIKAMGFSPTRRSHQWDCPYHIDAGLVCQCVRPATEWSQPPDVDVFRNDTLEDRRNDKRDRRIPHCER